ncbi:MAG: hypothetical protein BroJett011_62440 [Chloroflexota bacterium]|nr:MAG: hypothetical protein BroJett011_62440 [Chloroflexota bacterium]
MRTKNPIQKLIEDFDAERLHARRLSDGMLIEDLGNLVAAILADDCVIGPRSKFEQARAEFLAAREQFAGQVEAAANGTPARPFDTAQDRPFSRILIPSAEDPRGNPSL